MLFDLVIAGGGAAGCFAAVSLAAKSPGANILVLEKSSRLLSKVKISGGGRCNLTHSCDSISEMIQAYPRGSRMLKKTFHHFFTDDTIRWFTERDVSLITEPDGRMFPESSSSQSVIDALLREANRYNISFRLNCGVTAVKKRETFEIETTNGIVYSKNFLVACGGFPKPEQYKWLLELGHTIQPPVPSLFTFNMPANPIRDLMGISVPDARIKITGIKLEERGPLLITHWGLSGPAVLRLSAWGARELAAKNYHFRVLINWTPELHEESLREKMQEWRFALASRQIGNKNPLGLPQRLWEYLLEQAGISPLIRWADLPAKAQAKLCKYCTAQEHEVKGKTTFKEEFVTCGGISLAEIDPDTMMSRLVPHLFFAGEIMDVDGITGGYNFQHAWTSGFTAATEISKLLG